MALILLDIDVNGTDVFITVIGLIVDFTAFCTALMTASESMTDDNESQNSVGMGNETGDGALRLTSMSLSSLSMTRRRFFSFFPRFHLVEADFCGCFVA